MNADRPRCFQTTALLQSALVGVHLRLEVFFEGKED